MPAPTNHLPHLLMLLHAVERLRSDPGLPPSFSMPDRIFLARSDPEHFWELIALRLQGHPSLLFGAVRFRRQSKEASDWPRQSLVSYLSSPAREIGVAETPLPPNLIELMIPETGESILTFLERARGGGTCRKVLVDREVVELAFDLRLDNPSRHRPTGDELVGSDSLHLFRTVQGHILSAYPHRLSRKLLRSEDFLALRRATQHTTTSGRPLPTLVVNRSFLTMVARIEGGLAGWLAHSVPFLGDLANPKHLLDPLLESYSAYRQQLLHEEPVRRTA